MTVTVLHVFERDEDAALVGGVCEMELVSLHLVGPLGLEVADRVEAGFIENITINDEDREDPDA